MHYVKNSQWCVYLTIFHRFCIKNIFQFGWVHDKQCWLKDKIEKANKDRERDKKNKLHKTKENE